MKYVGTYSDPKDIVTKDKLEAVASRVSTNEDNIAMAESDIEGLQTTVGTLQTNVNNVQTALTSKQDTVVGGASTITENNLTASRALISNSSGKVAVSDVTSTELGYLDGVTSNIQTQLGDKQPTISVSGILKGIGNGNVEAAIAGTDYLAESDLYICTVTESGTSYTADKTPIELLTASRAGKLVVAKLNEAVYFFDGGNSQMALFTRVQDANVYGLRVTIAGTATLTTTQLQKSALITNLEANKDNNTSYPSAKAVYDAIPHPGAKTDTQTQPVSMDGDGKLWTAPSTDPDVFTGADATTAGAVGMVPAPTAGQQSKFLKGDGSWSDLPNASTGARGVTYLVDSYTRTDTDKAVTPKALNNVYKLIPVKVSQLENDSGYITIAAVPTKTSELENDSGFITFAPVTSVNGETGNVVLEASDVGAATTGNIQAYINRTSAVDEPNTSYTSYMARGEALYGYEATPSANGCIAWQYE